MSSTETARPASVSPAAGAADDKQVGKEPYKCPVVLVVGMAGSGKTTLVDTFSMWLENEPEMQDADAEEPDPTDDDVGGSSSGKAPAKKVDDATASSLKGGDTDIDINIAKSGSTAGAKESNTNTTTTRENDDEYGEILRGDGAYVVNLDPAVLKVPYDPNIDIRDTIDYKSVMSEYSLGPNGGILTSLNLYATRFDQVLSLVEKRATDECRCVLMDTPGQIETFTWSASGTIITESLAQTLPTAVVFVVDVPRASSPMTFVSSMLYACSIMYKTRLPMIICLNKADVAPDKAQEIAGWIEDFDRLDDRLKQDSNNGNNGFVDELARSMALALEEFYAVIKSTIISAANGTGMKQLAILIEEARAEYDRDYKPWMEEQKKIKEEIENDEAKGQIERLKNDIEKDRRSINNSTRHSSFAPKTEEELDEIEQELKAEEDRKRELKEADPEEIEAFNNFVDYLDKMDIKKSSNNKDEDALEEND